MSVRKRAKNLLISGFSQVAWFRVYNTGLLYAPQISKGNPIYIPSLKSQERCRSATEISNSSSDIRFLQSPDETKSGV